MQVASTNPGETESPQRAAATPAVSEHRPGGTVGGPQTDGGSVGLPRGVSLGGNPSTGNPGTTNSEFSTAGNTGPALLVPDPASASWLIFATVFFVIAFATDRFSQQFQWWVQARSKYRISLDLPAGSIALTTVVIIVIFILAWVPTHPELIYLELLDIPSYYGREISVVPLFVAALLFSVAVLRFGVAYSLASKVSKAANASKLRQGGPSVALTGGIGSLIGLTADIVGIWGALK
jgi:hypothetical protein